jgi:hypothetical protein
VYRYQGTDPNNRDNAMLRRALELGRPLLYLVAVQQGVYEPVFRCHARRFGSRKGAGATRPPVAQRRTKGGSPVATAFDEAFGWKAG